jgi:hypothetical protein
MVDLKALYLFSRKLSSSLLTIIGVTSRSKITPGNPLTTETRERTSPGIPSTGAKKKAAIKRTSLSPAMAAIIVVHILRWNLLYSIEAVPESTAPSMAMRGAMGGESGGIPVAIDDSSGVITPTARANGRSTIKPTINKGRNMGRKIEPRPIKWKRSGNRIPKAQKTAVRAICRVLYFML